MNILIDFSVVLVVISTIKLFNAVQKLQHKKLEGDKLAFHQSNIYVSKMYIVTALID